MAPSSRYWPFQCSFSALPSQPGLCRCPSRGLESIADCTWTRDPPARRPAGDRAGRARHERCGSAGSARRRPIRALRHGGAERLRAPAYARCAVDHRHDHQHNLTGDRCDRGGLLRGFNRGLWRNLAVRRLGRRRLGPSPGHTEEGFSFCLVLRSASPAKAIFGKSSIFIGRGHRALPSAQAGALPSSQPPAPGTRPLPMMKDRAPIVTI
jgi:hypothetical protein